VHDATNNPFWSYSLTQYQRPDVAHWCLHSQDIHGLDVNLILFACWLSELGVRIDDSIFCFRPISVLQQDLIEPLRMLRNALKAPSQKQTQVHHWREQVKQLELSAERIEQDWLYAWSQRQAKSTESVIELRKLNLSWVWRLGKDAADGTAEQAWIEATLRCFYPPHGEC